MGGFMDELDEMNQTDVITGIMAGILQHYSQIDEQEYDYRNIVSVFNKSLREKVDRDLWRRYQTNRYIDGPMLYFLICAYGVFFSFGTIGNCLAVSAVIRKASMRTPRNMFIINLAVSDLLLCVITMPLTLMEIVTTYWPLGNHELLCKTIGCLQAISIFVSTISITAIALDRYHVIVYPTKASVQRVGALLALAGIWTLACILAAPLFIVRILNHIDVDFPEIKLKSVDYCIEDWPTTHGRAYYSIFSIIIQYALPITVVSVAYFRICKKLRYRMKPGGQVNENLAGGGLRSGSLRKDEARVRRTNMLLISIALIFGISWMPLNVFNLIADIFDPFDGYKSRIVYAFCHLIGMSSANTNPLLYGFFNDNFRKEFRDIWISFKRCCCCKKTEDSVGRGIRESRIDREQTATVNYRKSKACPVDVEDGGEIEQSTLITQVLDRQK